MMKTKTNNLNKFKLNQQLPLAKHGQGATAETKNPSQNRHKCEYSRGKNTKSSKTEFEKENPYLLLEDFELKGSNNGV